MKISACLITKNEEHNIARCIESFKGYVNEIIVVDTGSTDNTVKVARKLGAKVSYFKWNNNFSDARNLALKQAKGNWIIFLDADEYFHGGTGQNIPSILKAIHPNKEVDALVCKIVNLREDGKIHSTTQALRIFRNSKQLKYKGNIHENLHKGDQNIGTVSMQDHKILICHTGYSSEDLNQLKQKRNLELLLNEIEKGRTSPEIYAYLSFCYSSFSDHENVIKYANQFLDSDPSQFSQTVKVWYTMITSMIESGHESHIIYSTIDKALTLFPEHPDLFWLLGQTLFNDKKYSEALDAFEKSVSFGLNYKGTQYTHWPSYQAQSYSLAGIICELKNNVNQAIDYYTKSLMENKNEVKILARLINLTKTQKGEDQLHFLKRIYRDVNIDDVRFITGVLAQFKLKNALNYYYNVWKNRFGNADIAEVFVLLTNAQYDIAFRQFNDAYTAGKNPEVAVLAATAALLSENETLIDQIKNASPTLNHLIDSYLGKLSETKFGENDFGTYMTILREFLRLGEIKQYNSWLKLKSYFNPEVSFTIGNLLLNEGYHELALDQFSEVIESDHPDKSLLYFNLGICHYKLFDYQKAIVAMEKALLNGYHDNDIFEILGWISKQCPDDSIRAKTKKLLDYHISSSEKVNP